MTRIIGIDLGTTNSLGAVFHDEGPLLIPNALGNYLTPSAVGYLEDGRILTGAAAREMAVTRPDRCALHFKRLMGSDQLKCLADREFSAPELSAMILKSIVSDCRAHLGEHITDVVITVPAYFNDHQRKATRLAGELVGLNVRRIINEPTAAALTYGFHEKSSEKKILVFDLGGGTFDVTLMEIFDGTLEIIATAGESQLGGQDFTELLVAWALAENKLTEPSLLQLARLHHEGEQVKLALSEAEEAFIRIPDALGHFAEGGPECPISRSHFEALSRPLIDRLMGTLFRCLSDAGCGPDEVEEVILVGGATRMPLISQVLDNYFGRAPLCRHNPDEVVALGAAIQAALIEDHELVEDLVMTDVCPFTLGVEVSRRLGSRVQDGYYLPLIHRNTTVPVSREEVLSTVYRNQDMVQLRIFQGEARRTRDNLLLGELAVTNIPPGREGQPIYVRFTYDMNGILEVEVLVAETGHRFNTVLTHHVKGLSQEQIELALQRMQEIKFYPRDEEKYQKLLFFGEQLLAELPPTERKELDAVIDTFEDALFGNSKRELELAQRLLLEMLEELGFPYLEDEDPKVDDSDFSAF